MGAIIIEGGQSVWGLDRYYRQRGERGAAIAGFVRKQLEEIINKVNILHLIFDLNSTTYAETYVISTRWIKLGFLVQTSPLSS